VSFAPGQTPGFRFFDLLEELESLLGVRVDVLTETGLATIENPILRAAILANKQLVYAEPGAAQVPIGHAATDTALHLGSATGEQFFSEKAGKSVQSGERQPQKEVSKALGIENAGVQDDWGIVTQEAHRRSTRARYPR
jgi:hypothetical protein